MTKKRGVVFCVAFILFALCGVLQASANETNYRVKLHHYPKSGAFLVNNELTVLEMGSVVGFNIVKSSNGEETFLTEEELKEYEWELDMDKNSPAGYCMTYTGRQNDGVLSVYIPLGNVGKVTITGKHDDTLHNVQTTFSVTDYDMYQGGKVLKGTLHWDLDGWLRLAEMSNVQWDADQRHYVAVMDEFPWALPRNGTNFVGWEIDEGDSSRIVQPGETVIFEGRPSATAV